MMILPWLTPQYVLIEVLFLEAELLCFLAANIKPKNSVFKIAF
jgi:hypothetical protein